MMMKVIIVKNMEKVIMIMTKVIILIKIIIMKMMQITVMIKLTMKMM